MEVFFILTGRLQYEIDRTLFFNCSFHRTQIDVADAVVAMDGIGLVVALVVITDAAVARALVDRDLIPMKQFQDQLAVGGRHIQIDIAKRRRYAQQFNVRIGQDIGDRQCVIDTGVTVNDHFHFCHSFSFKNAYILRYMHSDIKLPASRPWRCTRSVVSCSVRSSLSGPVCV